MRKLIRFIVYLTATLGLLFAIALAMFRLTAGDVKRFDAEIQYQMIDLGQGDFLRLNCVEQLLGNSRLFLKSDSIPWLYVSNHDRKVCWPEHPWDMREKHYTVMGRFEVKSLWIVDGHSVATLIDTFHLATEPFITK